MYYLYNYYLRFVEFIIINYFWLQCKSENENFASSVKQLQTKLNFSEVEMSSLKESSKNTNTLKIKCDNLENEIKTYQEELKSLREQNKVQASKIVQYQDLVL
jgi:predicted nuclease with TOPRIM domain